MAHYDVFNGDADGICALHQLRLAAPQDATLLTGVKRDIELLDRVPARSGDSVTVLDISLDRNRDALLALLERGVRVEYFDHHYAGTVPSHPALLAHIDPAPGECTSTLVDRHLDGRHRLWAVVAAFGDNLIDRALALARSRGLDEARVRELVDLGRSINYNAYGESEADLLIAPGALYRALQPYPDPFDFIARHPVAARLGDLRRQDMARAAQIAPACVLPSGSVYLLPHAAWARRVQGEFANELATRAPGRAHAVLCGPAPGGYSVSVRAPLERPLGADRLCRTLPGGGGRAAAAGIDRLAAGRLTEFIHLFGAAFTEASPTGRS